MKEQQLVYQCKKGNRLAQKQLYELYATPMFRLCYRYVNRKAEAEDLMIRGFEKVFRKIDAFENRGGGSLRGWIKRIMVNECLMHLRKHHPLQIELEAYQWDLDAPTSTDQALLAEDIYKIIQVLPTGYRTVFNLYALEGFSHKEIAAELNISESTSKSQLSRARSMLKRLIFQEVES